MKFLRVLFLFVFFFTIAGVSTSCSSQKEFSNRRGLMMPEKSDLPRNKKYKPAKKKKTYGSQKKKNKRR